MKPLSLWEVPHACLLASQTGKLQAYSAAFLISNPCSFLGIFLAQHILGPANTQKLWPRSVCAPAAWPIILAYISIQAGKKVGEQRSTFADNTVRALLDSGHQAWLNMSGPEVQAMFASQVWLCLAGCLAATSFQWLCWWSGRCPGSCVTVICLLRGPGVGHLLETPPAYGVEAVEGHEHRDALSCVQALPEAVGVDGGKESPAGGNGPITPEVGHARAW